MHPTLLGLDVGTTAAKAVLFDLHGKELALAEQIDPQKIWQAVQDVISGVTSQYPQVASMSAVGLSTQAAR